MSEQELSELLKNDSPFNIEVLLHQFSMIFKLIFGENFGTMLFNGITIFSFAFAASIPALLVILFVMKDKEREEFAESLFKPFESIGKFLKEKGVIKKDGTGSFLLRVLILVLVSSRIIYLSIYGLPI